MKKKIKKLWNPIETPIKIELWKWENPFNYGNKLRRNLHIYLKLEKQRSLQGQQPQGEKERANYKVKVGNFDGKWKQVRDVNMEK